MFQLVGSKEGKSSWVKRKKKDHELFEKSEDSRKHDSTKYPFLDEKSHKTDEP